MEQWMTVKQNAASRMIMDRPVACVTGKGAWRAFARENRPEEFFEESRHLTRSKPATL
jgi:hypothetical protein